LRSQFVDLGRSELKGKILWKTLPVSFKRLVETVGGYTTENQGVRDLEI
jgi:hypothetical protein